MTDLVIVGDQAYSEAEFASRERELERRRAWDRQYRQRPEVRARRAAYMRDYLKRPDVKAKHREYNRGWMRDKRRAVVRPQPVGYLHSLSCVAPHWRARKACVPIPVYSKKQDVAA